MQLMKQLRLCTMAFGVLVTVGIMQAQATTVEISINKVSQKMTVTVDGEREYVWPVSTGVKGHETPSGDFKPFRMEKEHFSQEWDNAPMPNAMFFTQTGHAIHGSMHVKSLGRRASHGCVRLAPENAAILYDIVQQAGMQNTHISLKGGFFDSFNISSNNSDNDKQAAERKPMKPLFADWFGGSEKTVKVADSKSAKDKKATKAEKTAKMTRSDKITKTAKSDKSDKAAKADKAPAKKKSAKPAQPAKPAANQPA